MNRKPRAIAVAALSLLAVSLVAWAAVVSSPERDKKRRTAADRGVVQPARKPVRLAQPGQKPAKKNKDTDFKNGHSNVNKKLNYEDTSTRSPSRAPGEHPEAEDRDLLPTSDDIETLWTERASSIASQIDDAPLRTNSGPSVPGTPQGDVAQAYGSFVAELRSLLRAGEISQEDFDRIVEPAFEAWTNRLEREEALNPPP